MWKLLFAADTETSALRLAVDDIIRISPFHRISTLFTHNKLLFTTAILDTVLADFIDHCPSLRHMYTVPKHYTITKDTTFKTNHGALDLFIHTFLFFDIILDQVTKYLQQGALEKCYTL